MSNLTKTRKKEHKEYIDIVRRTAMIRAGYDPKTITECTDLYNNAEKIARTASHAIKDGLQGKALLEAKKLICGDEWNAKRLNSSLKKKWESFFLSLGANERNVNYLLDFAGYREKGGKIETASHYREVKKIAGTDPEEIDKEYNEAGGSEIKTARELREKLTKKKIYVKNIFIEEVGPEPERGMNTMGLGSAMISKFPNVTETNWKRWYRTASRCMHPDHGGSVQDFAILNSINEMITTVIKNSKQHIKFETWQNDYKQWKEDHGYESDFIETTEE